MPPAGVESARPDASECAESCLVCGSSLTELLVSPDRLYDSPGQFHLAICTTCGAGTTLPPAGEDEIAQFYPASYSAHTLESGLAGGLQRVGQRWVMRRALARVPLRDVAMRATGELLDVGCGRGDIGAAFVRRGWRVIGVDPSAPACAVAKSRGVDARVGTLSTAGFDDGAFDAAVMSHVLEHVPDPVADLERLFRVLRPGGVLAVTVPNFSCWQRDRFGADWFPLDLPRHRTHFTPTSLRRALARAGFEDIRASTASDGGVALLASIQLSAKGRLLFTRGLGMWALLPLHVVLSPVNHALDRARGGGAFLHAVAYRRGPTQH